MASILSLFWLGAICIPWTIRFRRLASHLYPSFFSELAYLFIEPQAGLLAISGQVGIKFFLIRSSTDEKTSLSYWRMLKKTKANSCPTRSQYEESRVVAMSAFASSGQVNSWLSFKHFVAGFADPRQIPCAA